MRKYLGMVGFLVVVAAVVVGVGYALNYFAFIPAPYNATKTADGVTVNEDVFPFAPCTDPDFVKTHPEYKNCRPNYNAQYVLYSQPEIVVPAHTKVTMIISNYDSTSALINNYFITPQGIDSGSLTVDGQQTSSIDPSVVSHTFVIHSIVTNSSQYSNAQPWLYVGIPLTGVTATDPKAFDAAGMPYKPVVTEFTFTTGAPGHYVWQCFVPCGTGFNGFGGPMGTDGYMNGTFTVQ
ncbi:MAG TPA: hypothetical protein VF808_12455 [Ktedonobacterales bacterium]